MRIFEQLLIALTALFASTAIAQMPQGEYLDGKNAQFAENRKAMVSDRFVQVPIAGAKHDYRGYDQQIAQAVNTWLTKQETK